MPETTAKVMLFGHYVGAVTWLSDRNHALFEYEPSFAQRGLDVSPIHMPIARTRGGVQFSGLNRESFFGLPGLLADALPDRFGNAVIDAWLTRQGRTASSFNPVERLCYTGRRGMGALEFVPSFPLGLEESVTVDISQLCKLAQTIIHQRQGLTAQVRGNAQDERAILDIIRVGTSAGGARPKAVIAMNERGEIRSGQVTAPEGFEHWLLKFDGVDDLELGVPKGYGRIEYAYHLMAQAAGISMSPCQLLEENGRAHFMTRRFDRPSGERKLHMQSLCGIAHLDFNLAGAHGYEQAFQVMRQLRLSRADAEQQYRRVLFNVLARNQDDHTKNIAFLMDEQGVWSLSPAFDMTYAHNPKGMWTSQHQMTIAGKRDEFEREDLLELGRSISLPAPHNSLAAVTDAVGRWAEFAEQAGLAEARASEIGGTHRGELG